MKKVLVTGGAGFIGRNLVKSFLDDNKYELVRVLDNLSTGKHENLLEFKNNPKFEFVEGDIRDKETCNRVCKEIDFISHQAALGSVPRSILDPITSSEVNINGFNNILWSAKEAKIKRVVYASSSSVYGDLNETPKVESRIGKILSPYAATKMSNELFAEAFSKNYGITICGFRYFNVFGPYQDPFGMYSAVIPLFFKSAFSNIPPIINGDGKITRDFTPIENVVSINKLALINDLSIAKHYVFNVACGKSTSLNELWQIIQKITSKSINPCYSNQREGDILQSLADISYAKKILGYNPNIDIVQCLTETSVYFKNLFN